MSQSENPAKKRKWDLPRIGAWTLVLVLACWVGSIKNEKNTLQQEQYPLLAQDILIFWDMQKERTDKINKTAEAYISYYKLAPGQSLPPDTFFDEKDPTWKLLNKKEPIQVVTKFETKKTDYRASTVALLAIGNKVPQPGAKYAYTGIMWSQKLIGTSHDIHPKDNHAAKTLIQAEREVERKDLAGRTPDTTRPLPPAKP